MEVLKRSITGMAVALLLIVGAPALVLAQNANGQSAQERREVNQQQAPERQGQAQQNQSDTQTTGQENREAAQGRLQDAKLKACESREKAIKNIMARIVDRGEKQLELFTTIADRTKAFYVDNNLTLDNYDALVVEIDAKKTAAQSIIDTIKNTSTTFSCSGENPKGVADSFKESLKAEVKALQEYRITVKNLIVGVKSAQAVTGNANNGDQ